MERSNAVKGQDKVKLEQRGRGILLALASNTAMEVALDAALHAAMAKASAAVFVPSCATVILDVVRLSELLSSSSPGTLSVTLARNYIRSLPVMKKKGFAEVFQGANEKAIDLLERMLELDADKRPTATEALAHPYLASLADPSDEPSAEPCDQSFEDRDLSVHEWKRECSASI
ncbi:hypothetical protein HPB52_019271 [Rhipicephalus sanguineus]|uniref:mitogen-activated protein kinase n=1 Tax=Rhipicephalus sanguineus TaxID=34632 RepID=A0A9D4QE55_RHISA|nr:hypothetical protein HPB52_019271 [Rhipicephalus sanguineus]